MIETDTAERDPAAIFARCDRHLSGHGPATMSRIVEEMRDAIGDDDRPDAYGQSAFVQTFERELADLLGKEAAVVLPSGTMTQQIALRIWSERSGKMSVAYHPTCHLEIHEQKGLEILHGIHARLVGDARRLITLADLEEVAEPVAALLLELPQREIGGQLPSWDDLQAQLAWARDRGFRTHMDGARLWESGPYYDRTYTQIAAGFDSVYVSFYKGLGALGGAALAGPEDFIREARVWARRHGGNLFRMFPDALSARGAIARRIDAFPAYHRRAIEVARVLTSVPGVRVKPDPPQTNMMHVYLEGSREALLDRALTIAEEEGVALLRYMRDTDVPDVWMFELSIGDGALTISDDEIRRYFLRVTDSPE